MLLDELKRSGGSAAQLLATWGSNIQRWPTGFKNGGNKGGPQSALVKTGKGVPDHGVQSATTRGSF